VSAAARAAGQRGMTLVELMIAVIILSVVVAAAFSVSYSIMNSYREHSRAINVERSARGAIAFLVDAVRNASPGVPDGQITDLVGCEDAWQGIRVVNGVDAPDQLDLIYGTGGVVTTLREAFTDVSTQMVVENAELLQPDDQILITNFDSGHLFSILTVTPAGPDWILTLRGGAPQAMCAAPLTAFNYPIRSTVLRVQKARFTVSTTEVPVLMMDRDGDGTLFEPEPVAEGVEDLQIAIAVDVNGNGTIEPELGNVGNDDDWVYNHSGDTIQPTMALSTYRAIRLTVIARSMDETTSVASSLRPGAEDRAGSTVADVFRRRSLSTTVEIRNIEGSP